jgi:hypothetical protein
VTSINLCFKHGDSIGSCLNRSLGTTFCRLTRIQGDPDSVNYQLFIYFGAIYICFLCAFREVARAVARIIALALDLKVDFFDQTEMFGEPIATLRLLHYEG